MRLRRGQARELPRREPPRRQPLRADAQHGIRRFRLPPPREAPGRRPRDSPAHPPSTAAPSRAAENPWLDRLGNPTQRRAPAPRRHPPDAAGVDLLADRADGPTGRPPTNTGLTVTSTVPTGAGQGTQALRLAREGHRVTAVDIAEEMLAPFRAALESEPAAVRRQVTLHVGTWARDYVRRPTVTTADLVLCQGVLMYLDDPGPALAGLAAATGAGRPMPSLVARNREAMALRHAMRRQAKALAAFDDTGYVNELGVAARPTPSTTSPGSLAGHSLMVESGTDPGAQRRRTPRRAGAAFG